MSTAATVEIESGLSIPVVTIPAFVVLKMMAFNDRAQGRQKWKSDAQDILYCLDKYEDIRYSDRRYSLFEKFPEIDVNYGGAVLLGLDISSLGLEDQTQRQITQFLAESRDPYSDFVSAICVRLLADQEENKRSEATSMLRAFSEGFSRGP